jgi:DNA-binding response OmpR family regulator
LVDDDKFLLDMYAMKFTQAGFNVHASLSVRNALDTLARRI